MVESFELTVPYVPTDENPADFLTKPHYNVAKFYNMRRKIMNEPDRAPDVSAEVSRPSSEGGRS